MISRVVVAICTHNPVKEKLEKVVLSIINNSVACRILIVDNDSDNLVPEIIAKEYKLEKITEPRLGNSYARFTAIQNVYENELLIFVDDDNYLSDQYVDYALRLTNEHSDWGAFGGKQIQSSELIVRKLFKPLLPYVGIRNPGPVKLESLATPHWAELEPIGAGMCLSPTLVSYLKNSLAQSSHFFDLGRKGSALLSGEDSFIARSAFFIDLKWGYSPNLFLVHDINHNRVNLNYFCRLLFSYGISDVYLDKAIGNTNHYPYPDSFFNAFIRWFYTTIQHSGGWILGLRHFGQLIGSRRLSKEFNN